MSRANDNFWSAWFGVAAMATVLVPGLAQAEGGGQLSRVSVPADHVVLTLFGASTDPRVLVYLPGKCGNAMAPVEAFPAAARAHGTLIVVEGDIPCPRSTRRRWGTDIAAIDRRIRAAVDAVSLARRAVSGPAMIALDQRRATVLGYSEGALRAESLAKQFPDRYPAAVILASPRKPSASSFSRSERVAFVVGTKDRRDEMRDGADETRKAGRPSRFFLLPGAVHGKYGPEGERVMGDVLDFVGALASPAPPPTPPPHGEGSLPAGP